MRVAVLCEYSGTVRDAFIAQGHDAVSCDLLPTDAPGPHIVGDCMSLDWSGYDLVIAHPPCTYLCNSGVRWLHTRPERWQQMRDAAGFFAAMLALPVPRLCVENPIMHGHAASIIGQRQTQIIHPWQFGHGESKATCLWLRGLPKLEPTKVVGGRIARMHLAPPSADRWKIRSTTYPGIAQAMAIQWGKTQETLFG